MPIICRSPFVYKLWWVGKYMHGSLLAKWSWGSLAVLLISGLLVSCSGFGGNTSGTDSSAHAVALSGLPWCNNKPDETFMNDAPQSSSASTGPANETPVAISWSFLKANLGFTLFLPATLPN